MEYVARSDEEARVSGFCEFPSCPRLIMRLEECRYGLHICPLKSSLPGPIPLHPAFMEWPKIRNRPVHPERDTRKSFVDKLLKERLVAGVDVQDRIRDTKIERDWEQITLRISSRLSMSLPFLKIVPH